MMPLAAAEHFAGPPDWTWYILFYFFLAGLAGGSYVIATLLRHWGEPSDEPAARLGYTVAFPIILVCPILLAVDLGKPALFWHMLVNTTAGAQSLNFKARSPMSIGSWALLVFSLFAAVSFLEALVHGRVIRLPIGDAFGFPWILLWLVALAGLVPGLGGLATRRLAIAGESFTGQGTVAAQSALTSVAVPVLVLIGVLALRAAVIFSAQ